MAASVLRFDGVSKAYGGRTALEALSLELRSGEAVGYLGPNGAGKSTTLKLAVGLLRPDRGTVRLFGADPRASAGAALAHVGALLETPGTVPYLRGRDLLEYVAEVRSLPAGTERTRAVEAAASETDVVGELDRPMGGLSTGQLRRVLIASALVGGPELLVLDEPTLGLDPAARQDLRRLLRRLRTQGRTLLLSTHLLEDVEAVCDRVVFLRDGRMVGDEPVRRTDAGTGERRLRVDFRSPVAAEAVTPRLGPTERWTPEGSSSGEVTFEGGDARQAELIAALVRGGLPVLSARRAGDDLTERYLERVGREERA